MALINCPECHNEVSSTAIACPHCGFGVAHFLQEEERKQQEIERQKIKQRLIEEKKSFQKIKKAKNEEKRNAKLVAKKEKTNHLNLYGKRSFWILPATFLWAVISSVMPHVAEFIRRKNIGWLISEEDTILNWLFRNVVPILPVLTVTAFTLFLIPSVLYIIANNIKGQKAAKLLLIICVVYNALLLLISVIVGFFNGFDITIILRFLIPMIAYIALFFKATSNNMAIDKTSNSSPSCKD